MELDMGVLWLVLWTPCGIGAGSATSKVCALVVGFQWKFEEVS